MVLAPPIALWIAISVLYLTMTSADQAAYIGSKYFQVGVMAPTAQNLALQYLGGNIYDYLIRLQGLLICIYCTRLMHDYNTDLKKHYTYIDEKVTKLNGYALISTFVLYLMMLIFSKVLPETHVSNTSYQEYAYFVSSICFFMMGYDAYKIKFTAADFLEDKNLHVAKTVEMKITSDDVSTSEEYALHRRLSEAMQKEKLYLKSDLTLDDLARALQTNRTYLSKMVNTKYKHSFSAFVNVYRVEHSKELMLKEPDATLEWVGLQSGFISYNSFFHTFRETEGMAPGKWRKKNMESEAEGSATINAERRLSGVS